MKNKKVLVIGSGGREHALTWALSKSPQVQSIFCAPGNGGMSNIATLVNINITDHQAVTGFVKKEKIDLVVIGPEAPLVDGLSDSLRKEGILTVGASQKAAQLEGSKIFAKEFMNKYGIPTAAYRMFDNIDEAKKFATSPEGKSHLILKADGLAAGKGVFVNKNTDELLNAISTVMGEKKFGSAGEKVLLEETLEGPEISIIALTDGKTVLPFPASQDHKRAFDKDQGPNTGGMGAYSPTPFYDDAIRVQIQKDVIENFTRGLQSEGLDFRGFIYFGLMLTKSGPKVLEFNVRFGDPEAQAVLPLIDSDLYETFLGVAKAELSQSRLSLKDASACTVVIASGGYPGSFEKGFDINGLAEAEKEGHVIVFHAGTKKTETGFQTSGGRVLAVTGIGKSLDVAVVRAYQGVKKISFKNGFYRNDIAGKALNNQTITSRVKRMSQRHAREIALI